MRMFIVIAATGVVGTIVIYGVHHLIGLHLTATQIFVNDIVVGGWGALLMHLARRPSK